MNKCDICKKDRGNFEGLVDFSSDFNSANLCRSHYMKWCRYHKPYRESHKNVQPLTKAWSKMCWEEGKFFEKWFANEQKSEGDGQ